MKFEDFAEFGAEDDEGHYLATSPLYGMKPGEFLHIDGTTRDRLRKLIAQCCEKSFRRGFQQGYETHERGWDGDEVVDIEAWRFFDHSDVSRSPHVHYEHLSTTSIERMDMECHVSEVGLIPSRFESPAESKQPKSVTLGEVLERWANPTPEDIEHENECEESFRRGYLHGAFACRDAAKALNRGEVDEWLERLQDWRDAGPLGKKGFDIAPHWMEAKDGK